MAEKYEVADMIVALGGDINNTVPRYNVTAAECAVLQAIHGADAVTSLKITGAINRTNRVEKARIMAEYAPTELSNGAKIIARLYPGAAARMFERYDELELSESQFAPGCVPKSFVDIREEAAAEVDAGLANIDDDEPGEDLFADEKPEDGDDGIEAASTEQLPAPKVSTTASRRQAKIDAAVSGALA